MLSRRRFLKAAAGTVPLLAAGSSWVPRAAALPLAAPRATRIFRSGVVLTMDGLNREARAIAVKDSRILAVGSDAEVLAFRGPLTDIVDLRGRTVLPGFVEPHLHLAGTLAARGFLDLQSCWYDDNHPGCIVTFEDAMSAVGAGAQQTRSAAEWVVGFGLDPSRLVPSFKAPDRRDLDRAAARNPVLVLNQSGHIAYVNSRALTVAGVTDTTPDPPGGHYVKDHPHHRSRPILGHRLP